MTQEFLSNWGSQARKGSLELVVMASLAEREFYGYEHANFAPLFAGCFVAGMGGLFLVFAVAYALALFLAARFLAQRRRHTFCVVVAAISCTFTPVGTVLGVFTLIVLFRPSVRLLFGLEAPPAAA